MIRDLDIVQLFKLWQLANHMLSVAGNRGHWVLSEPDYFKVFQGHQMLNFIDIFHAVSSNVKFFELGTGADIFQCRDTVDRE